MRKVQERIHRCRSYLGALMPHACVVCTQVSNQRLCVNCYQNLNFIEHACPVCAIPMSVSELCGACLKSKRYLDGAWAVLNYEGEICKLIQEYKYHKGFHIQPVLRDLLSDFVKRRDLPKVEAVVGMPMHRYRWLFRGFNHIIPLAKTVARTINAPMLPTLVVRVKHTPRFAAGKTKAQRRALVKRAFKVTGKKIPKSVLIIDDVMTTGASCEALAKTLKQSGVMHVYALVLARVEST